MRLDTDNKTETLFETPVTLEFHGKSKYTFKHVRFYHEGKAFENMHLIGARGTWYSLQHLNPYGNKPEFEGVYQPISVTGGPLMKRGNPMFVFVVGGIVSVFKK